MPRVSDLRSDSPLIVMSVDVPYSGPFGYPCRDCALPALRAGGPASSSDGEESLSRLPLRGGDDVHCCACVRPGPCPSNDTYVLSVPSLDHQSEHVPSSVFSSHASVGRSVSAPLLAIAAHERWPTIQTFDGHLALHLGKSGHLVSSRTSIRSWLLIRDQCSRRAVVRHDIARLSLERSSVCATVQRESKCPSRAAAVEQKVTDAGVRPAATTAPVRSQLMRTVCALNSTFTTDRKEQFMSQSRGAIRFEPLFTAENIGLRKEASVEHAIKAFLTVGEAVAARWIEMPRGVLLLQIVAGNPASGAIYVYDRERQIFYFVFFDEGRDDSLSVRDFEELAAEYDLVSWTANPGLLPAIQAPASA